jgi:hypothetical protein
MNRYVVHAHEHSVRWAEQFAVVQTNQQLSRLRAAKMAWMMGGFYPEAGEEEMNLAADYLCWAFALDDLGDESAIGWTPAQLAALLERFEAIVDGGQPTADDPPSVVALKDIVERLAAMASVEQAKAFADANRAYFGGMLWEANNRVARTVPDEASFYMFRPPAGAVPPAFALILPLENIAVPLPLLSHPAVQPLQRTAGNVMCWINDVLSFEKEMAHGDVHNLAMVLADAYGLSNTDALWRAVRQCNDEVRQFLTHEAQLPKFGAAIDERLARYAGVLRSMMKTTLDWTLDSARYRSDRNAAIA